MKKSHIILIVFIISLLLIACSNDSSESDMTKNDAVDVETIEVTHELDDEPVTLPINPQKIAVFDIGILDTIQYLGEEDRVVGFPKATIPAYLDAYDTDQYENFGSLKEPEFEAIHAAQPDIIIISGRQMELYDQFKEIAPTLYINLDPEHYMESVRENVMILGQLFDRTEVVSQLIEETNREIEDIRKLAEDHDETALIVLGTEGKISAFGPSSRFGIIHDVFGIAPADEHIEQSTHGQSITFEYILETNPDIIYVIDRDSAIGIESSVKESFENDIVQKTDAFKNNRIIYLNGDTWYLAGGGLQALNMMIEEISQSIE